MPQESRTIVIVGGTSGIGLGLARACAERGWQVVITGRDTARAQSVAEGIGPNVSGLGFDLSAPESIGAALEKLGTVDHVVLSAIERDRNTLKDYAIDRAVRLTTLKLVGYTEVVHALADRLRPRPSSSVVLIGGMAGYTPYPGSTTVSTVNAGLSGLMRSMVLQLAPVRVNTLHPGLVGDTPAWENASQVLENIASKTPTKQVTTTADMVHGLLFLIDNPAVNGVEIKLDGGMHVQSLV
ncbi:MAG TPA: SDR family oxidoreductase [Oscillatoriaceae cyanobacterium]